MSKTITKPLDKFDNIKDSPQNAPFSAEAIKQSRIASNLQITSFLHSRLDLRGKTVFTFSEGENDRDKCLNRYNDCAFSVEKRRDIYRLGIHVADADEYVPEGSPLDLEAKARGGSVFLPGKTLHMLEEEVYNKICFLEANKDRLAVSIFLDIDKDGRVLSLEFYESVIRVAINCMFSEVDSLLSSMDSSSVLPLREKYAPLMPHLTGLYELGATLLSKRNKNNISVFKRVDLEYKFDDDGAPEDIKFGRYYDVQQLARELLIFAGRTIGEYVKENSLPWLYACRPFIESDKMKEITPVLGIKAEVREKMTEKEIQDAIFAHAMDNGDINAVRLLASKELPAMQYALQPIDHSFYGGPYVRFAYPSSRYADLAVQRLLKTLSTAKGEITNVNISKQRKNVAEAAIIANAAETRSREWRTKVSEEFVHLLLEGDSETPREAFVCDITGEKMKIVLTYGITGELLLSADGSRLLKVGEKIQVKPSGVYSRQTPTFVLA